MLVRLHSQIMLRNTCHKQQTRCMDTHHANCSEWSVITSHVSANAQQGTWNCTHHHVTHHTADSRQQCEVSISYITGRWNSSMTWQWRQTGNRWRQHRLNLQPEALWSARDGYTKMRGTQLPGSQRWVWPCDVASTLITAWCKLNTHSLTTQQRYNQ